MSKSSSVDETLDTPNSNQTDSKRALKGPEIESCDSIRKLVSNQQNDKETERHSYVVLGIHHNSHPHNPKIERVSRAGSCFACMISLYIVALIDLLTSIRDFCMSQIVFYAANGMDGRPLSRDQTGEQINGR